MKLFFSVTLFLALGIMCCSSYAQGNSSPASFNTPNSPGSNLASKHLFIDVHHLGAGKVTAKQVAAAHQKDLAAEGKNDVSFINYWVDEKNGVVMCLSEASDSSSVINTHKEAHGLLPASVLKVKQGN